MDQSDRFLVDAYLKGDIAAFETLVSRYEGPLLRYAGRLVADPNLAQDVVQESFLRLIREVRGIDHVEDLSVWLYRVCRNASIDVVRKEARMRKTHERAQALKPELSPTPDPVEAREAESIVQRELDSLPARQRDVLLLRVQQRKSYSEISSMTGLTEGNVGYLIHHGLRDLAQRLRAAGVL